MSGSEARWKPVEWRKDAMYDLGMQSARRHFIQTYAPDGGDTRFTHGLDMLLNSAAEIGANVARAEQAATIQSMREALEKIAGHDLSSNYGDCTVYFMDIADAALAAGEHQEGQG